LDSSKHSPKSRLRRRDGRSGGGYRSSGAGREIASHGAADSAQGFKDLDYPSARTATTAPDAVTAPSQKVLAGLNAPV